MAATSRGLLHRQEPGNKTSLPKPLNKSEPRSTALRPDVRVNMNRFDDLAYLGIAEASAMIRKRRLSPVELAEACLGRIKNLNERLNAFITVTSESALKDAHRAEEDIRKGRYRGPLHGIPIAHKDNIWTKGVRTTANSRLLRDWVPTEDATVARKLRRAGAVCLGKTTLHEFAFGSPGADEAFPAARNPWNTEYAPGSSSSGSAVGVAAGLSMGATGTDTGGSIRFPASICGVVGMKPTFGTVSAYGVIPLSPSLDHVGPLTRTVRDNALMLQVMAGPDPRDSTSVKHEKQDFQRLIGGSIRDLKLGIPRRFIDSIPHHPEMLSAFRQSASALEELGARIRTIDIPELSDANDAAMTIIAWEADRYHRKNLDANPDLFGVTFRKRLALATNRSQADYRAALRKGRTLRAAYDAVFASGIDLILSPGCEGPACLMTELLANPAKRSQTYRMYNLSGIPALTMPMGFTRDGLPLGLQFAAHRFGEPLIYQVAEAFESAIALHKRPPTG